MYFPLSSVRAMGLTLFIYYYQANILLPYLKENACSIYKKNVYKSGLDVRSQHRVRTHGQAFVS